MQRIDREKVVLLLSAYFTVKNCQNNDKVITFNDSYDRSCEQTFAYYDDTSVYIGNEEDIYSIKGTDRKNIYIIDGRYDNDPVMSVCDSYQIRDIRQIRSILRVLVRYEQEYPSLWERTFNSMEREWLMHNICYYLNYESYHTEKVDLNNDNEANYDRIWHIIFNARELMKSDEEESTLSLE